MGEGNDTIPDGATQYRVGREPCLCGDCAFIGIGTPKPAGEEHEV